MINQHETYSLIMNITNVFPFRDKNERSHHGLPIGSRTRKNEGPHGQGAGSVVGVKVDKYVGSFFLAVTNDKNAFNRRLA